MPSRTIMIAAVLLAILVQSAAGQRNRSGRNALDYPEELTVLRPDPAESTSRWRAGLRMHHLSLVDNHRPVIDVDEDGEISDNELLDVSFLGSIITLEVKGSYLPKHVYLQYLIDESFGVELSWEHFRAQTWTFWDGHTDGIFDLQGPLASVFMEYPVNEVFTPSIGLGAGYLMTVFDHDPAWRYVAGIVQTIATSDEISTFVYVDCDIAITENWQANVFVRYMRASLKTHYYLTWPDGSMLDDRGITVFPMDSITYGFGAHYLF